MTIEEIAKKLDDCANIRCSNCKHIFTDDLAECQTRIIEEMADECRKLVEQMGDDGK